VNARRCLKADLFLSRDADRALLGFDLEIDLVNARELDDRDEIIALLKDVEGRKGAGPGGAAPEPVALVPRIKRALQREDGVEWTTQAGRHACLPRHGVRRAISEMIGSAALAGISWAVPARNPRVGGG